MENCLAIFRRKKSQIKKQIAKHRASVMSVGKILNKVITSANFSLSSTQSANNRRASVVQFNSVISTTTANTITTQTFLLPHHEKKSNFANNLSEAQFNNNQTTKPMEKDIPHEYHYTDSVRNQKSIAAERLSQMNSDLELKLVELRNRYRILCTELESRKAENRLCNVIRDMVKEPVIRLQQYIIRLPEPLNRSERELYVDRLIINVLQELQDMNKISLGETLDDDVITTVMEACQQKHSDILFVNPCITQCIQFSQNDAEIESFLDPIEAKRFHNIFFVINDTSNGSQGTHWSLLMVNKAENAFCHYDSMKGTNFNIAYELSRKLSAYFSWNKVIEVDCEQQTNNTDCGVFVLDNILKITTVLKNNIMIEKELITPLKIIKLPPSQMKTRIYMINTYIKSILQKIKRTLRLEKI